MHCSLALASGALFAFLRFICLDGFSVNILHSNQEFFSTLSSTLRRHKHYYDYHQQHNCRFLLSQHHTSCVRRESKIQLRSTQKGYAKADELDIASVVVPPDSTPPWSIRAVTLAYLRPNQEPGLLCDFLMEIGACSTSITDSYRGTDQEQPWFDEPSSTSKRGASELWGHGGRIVENKWKYCNLTAHFPSSIDLDYVIDLIMQSFPHLQEASTTTGGSLPNYQVEQVPNRDWVIHVQQGWKPVVIGNKFLLRFPWHMDHDVEQQKLINGNQGQRLTDLVEIELQGGVAFGTGEHPTTQLCLEWLHEVVTDLLLPPTLATRDNKVWVLDYGTGSGVLGIAACCLSRHSVRAIGVDIDLDACRIANVNAKNNNATMWSFLPTQDTESMDDESKSVLWKAQNLDQRLQWEEANDEPLRVTATAMSKIPSFLNLKDDGMMEQWDERQYDVAVANILAGPLVTLAPVLYDRIRPSGLLGLSGILAHQQGMILDSYQAIGFRNVEVRQELNGWVLITAQKP